jgi:hypothetical protein
MAYIDKLLNKFNKAQNAINSIKGIQSKIQAINYTSAIDALGIEKDAAKTLINARRESLEEQLQSSGMAIGFARETPTVQGINVVYPFHDQLENYIVFDIIPRKSRGNFAGHPVHEERSIALYVPDALISQASVGYRNEGISSFQRTIDGMIDGVMNKSVGDGAKQSFDGAKKMATKFVTEAANKMQGGLTNLKAGRASNPLQEQMLDGIPFRSWDFTFDFWPKSSEEATKVNEIIYTFRSSMLPDAYTESADVLPGDDGKFKKEITSDKDTNANYFNYPNVFDIRFEGPLGDKIDGFLPAVCTNAQVDYTGGQKFSTFADGQPVHIQLTLNFLEIKTMTLGNYESISPQSQRELNERMNAGPVRSRAPTQDSAFNKAARDPSPTIDGDGDT